ncbi:MULTISPECIES: Uma2 family endonuclease [unclassified Amycolatopsis]|uniref:Uma2 family endonuclease n=1 Tax=unclassified Amycolatopsis TaxID=2618356 RepID=UPI001F31A4D4|nr:MULTISPECIES: Uma2 family endonuclease [unclassified Amycolatopsis]
MATLPHGHQNVEVRPVVGNLAPQGLLADAGKLSDLGVTKFSEYAEVGIEHYWIVDLEDPASMTTYRPIDGEYENFGEHTGKASLDFDGTPLTFDLDALTTRHAQRP